MVSDFDGEELRDGLFTVLLAGQGRQHAVPGQSGTATRARIAAPIPRSESLLDFDNEDRQLRLIELIDAAQKSLFAMLTPIKLDDTGHRVFEASTGWALPGYRRTGLQLRLRRRLYSELRHDLMISFCVGLGATLVPRRLG